MTTYFEDSNAERPLLGGQADYNEQGVAKIRALLQALADRNGPDSISARELAHFDGVGEPGMAVALGGLVAHGEASQAEADELTALALDPHNMSDGNSRKHEWANSIRLDGDKADELEDALARLGGLIREAGEPLRSQLVAEFRVAVALINADAGPLSPHLEPVADLLA